MERGATDRATFEVRVDANVVEFGGTVRVAVPVDTACPAPAVQ